LFAIAITAEEKMDEYLQQLSYQHEYESSCMNNSEMPREAFSRAPSQRKDDMNNQSFHTVLRELAVLLNERVVEDASSHEHPTKKSRIEVSSDVERLLGDASAALSDSRPPANFVVYEDGNMLSSSTHERTEAGPPIFDGSVANSTPPPLGGPAAGASGGAGTILHLACALDVPLALALMLALGADARASHTAFRRLMIHEAACCGSIQCLTLLLELGAKYGAADGEDDVNAKMPSRPRAATTREMGLPFLPRRIDRGETYASLQLYAQQSGLFTNKKARAANAKDDNNDATDFLSILRVFRECTEMVKKGTMSELDAARKVLRHASLADTSVASLARSCSFTNETTKVARSILRPQGGTSDGHGNTPLHWAAFKNETECVSLLLKFGADANARAHPSGWTPLHDAAYSNSKESIELLLNAGASVDARANSGATPLCFAAQEDAAGAACLLLERGADLTTRCAGSVLLRDDGTATAAAAATVAQGTHPHSRFSGYTPLHYCAHYNAHKAAKVLLRHSTAPKAMEIPDLSDRLPIHVAVARGSSDVLRELLHAGARVETRERSNSRDGGRGVRRFNSLRQHSGISHMSEQSQSTPTRRSRPPSPEEPTTPRTNGRRSPSATPVSSPMLRSMIPSQPVTSSKPWNCLSQSAIDECKELIYKAEQNWAPDRHLLFTPADRKAVMELLRVGKRLEQQGKGIFIDLWPEVLSFCGRGWFETEVLEGGIEGILEDDSQRSDAGDGLSLPSF
jgi:hypothetical protein